jgi:L-ascorbate metabolism protein UlaG (beta-lactamase superfamily)
MIRLIPLRKLVLLLALGALSLATGCGGGARNLDLSPVADPPEDSITFWGHASTYIDAAGTGIVTDPMFEDSYLLVMRRKAPVPPPAAYAEADIVLYSHPHPDHFSKETLATFPAEVTVVCPHSVAHYLEDSGRTLHVVAPGDVVAFPGGEIEAVPAWHSGERMKMFGHDHDGALGYVIRTEDYTLYWSGDTDFFPGMEEIGTKHRPDIAMLNINGHLHSEEVVQAVHALRVGRVLPVHHGAYGFLFFGEREQPRGYEDLAKWLGPVIQPLEIGEAMSLADVRGKREKRSVPGGLPVPGEIEDEGREAPLHDELAAAGVQVIEGRTEAGLEVAADPEVVAGGR